MKNKTARALAIVALVCMAIFIAAMIMTFIDRTLLNGSVMYIAIGMGVMTFMIFIALKADGRGYSITKMNNEMEMERIQKALEEQEAREKAQKDAEGNGDGDSEQDASIEPEADEEEKGDGGEEYEPADAAGKEVND